MVNDKVADRLSTTSTTGSNAAAVTKKRSKFNPLRLAAAKSNSKNVLSKSGSNLSQTSDSSGSSRAKPGASFVETLMSKIRGGNSESRVSPINSGGTSEPTVIELVG